jgi:hypothetical protein
MCGLGMAGLKCPRGANYACALLFLIMESGVMPTPREDCDCSERCCCCHLVAPLPKGAMRAGAFLGIEAVKD